MQKNIFQSAKIIKPRWIEGKKSKKVIKISCHKSGRYYTLFQLLSPLFLLQEILIVSNKKYNEFCDPSRIIAAVFLQPKGFTSKI